VCTVSLFAEIPEYACQGAGIQHIALPEPTLPCNPHAEPDIKQSFHCVGVGLIAIVTPFSFAYAQSRQSRSSRVGWALISMIRP